MNWHFYTSTPLDGQSNMDIDEQDAMKVEQSLSKKENVAYFRVYSWNAPTLSLGRNQKIDEQIIANCHKQNISIVRRPTGGRAVLHANELTYCATMPCLNSLQAQKAYQSIHVFIKKALAPLNINDLDFEKSQINLNEHYQNLHSQACFSSSARYELTCNGKKLIGSAQRVQNGVLLQHGSLPLDRTHLEIASIISNSDTQSEMLKERLHNSSISLSECIGKAISFNEVAEMIENAFLTDSTLLP